MKTTALLTALVAITTLPLSADTSSLYDIPLKDIDGKDTSLKQHEGKAMLIVNVASKCGYTPQYEGLEALYQQYKDQGLVVLGFPCNDFGSQEPGTEAEIKEFCTTQFNVTFPMYSKLHVKGADQHPLYTKLSGKDSPFPGDVRWNFGKFLVGPDGTILARFESRDKPQSDEVVQAVEAALKSAK